MTTTMPVAPLIVLVDDESEILAAIKRCLMRVDVAIESFTSPRLALEFIRQHEPKLVISDQRMPDISGQQLLTEVKQLWPNCQRIMLSAYRDFDQVAESFNQAVIERFIAKPWQNKELIFTVEQAIAKPKRRVKSDKTRGSIRQNNSPSSLGTRIIGESAAMQALFTNIAAAAGANVPIFIHGETGTGKELVAKACHQQSYRANGEFVAVNCANFSESLIESQLFGHKKGAFTGAVSDQVGVLSQCQGGTLFLDEVTTLPLPLQAKLLRVLQEREFSPLGDNKVYRFDAQIVSASSVKLVDAVKVGDFREDLYYRLNVIPLQLPPLRNRADDIVLIANHYLKQYSQEQGKKFQDFSVDAKQFLLTYAWPGNVRQLENLVHSAVIMNSGTKLTQGMLAALLDDELIIKPMVNYSAAKHSDIELDAQQKGQPTQPSTLSLAEVEKQAILQAIEQCQGNINQAAALLDINPSTIYRKMQRWG